mmetsp:Transcript_645/g.1336  ORF Transcript_645/g.1336 Transcript_645/m.1336 type:complete len:106 (-) Transcript_645:251-568(-)
MKNRRKRRGWRGGPEMECPIVGRRDLSFRENPAGGFDNPRTWSTRQNGGDDGLSRNLLLRIVNVGYFDDASIRYLSFRCGKQNARCECVEKMDGVSFLFRFRQVE